MEQQPGDDHAQLRIGHSERDRVTEFLRVAAGEGRLDLEELDERLEQVAAARTAADLVPAVRDLPGAQQVLPAVVRDRAPAVRAPSAVEPVGTEARFTAILGDAKRGGRWTPSPQNRAIAMLGDVVLDLREAALPDVVTVIATAVLGDVKVIVGPTTRVELEGEGMLGSVRERAKVPAAYAPDAPTVRVRGSAVMGDVLVIRRPLPGQSRRSGRPDRR